MQIRAVIKLRENDRGKKKVDRYRGIFTSFMYIKRQTRESRVQIKDGAKQKKNPIWIVRSLHCLVGHFRVNYVYNGHSDTSTPWENNLP